MAEAFAAGVAAVVKGVVVASISYAVQRLLAPGRDDVVVGKLNNIQPASRDEGVGTVRAFGRNVRMPGHFLWQQWPPEETRNTSYPSGKSAGAGNKFVTYTYQQSFAVEWCKCFGYEVESLSNIWGNGNRVFYDRPDRRVVASDQIRAEYYTDSQWLGTTSSGTDRVYYRHIGKYVNELGSTGGPTVTDVEAVAEAGVGLSIFRRASGSWTTDGFVAGMTVLSSGFTESANNNQEWNGWVVDSVSATDLTVEDPNDLITDESAATANSVRQTVNLQVFQLVIGDIPDPAYRIQVTGFTNTGYNSTTGVGEGFTPWSIWLWGPLGTIEQELDLILEEGEASYGSIPAHPAGANESSGNVITLRQIAPPIDPVSYQSVAHYWGSLTQQPDPTIVAQESSSVVPGFRDRCYSVFTNWQNITSGNVVPQIIEALLVIDSTETVKTTLDKILDTAGIDATKRDTSEFADDALEGFWYRDISDAEAIAQLVIAYDIMIVDNNGILEFKKRANLDVETLVAADLGAHAPGEVPARDAMHRHVVERDLPAGFVVNYMDPERDYQVGSQSYVLQNPGEATDVPVVDLTRLVLTAAEAQAICRRLTWTSWVNGHGLDEIQVGPEFSYLRAGQKLSLPLDGRTWQVLITEARSGADDIVRLKAVEEQTQTLTHTTPDDPLPVDNES
ncbi:MAG: phage tail protein [Rhodospirillaceae bacterium]